MQHQHRTQEGTGSRLIQSVLTPAIRFWIGTQVEHADNVQILIQSRDRQILAGHIPTVWLAAEHVCYRGLHLGRLNVSATHIRVNWWGIAKGQPLRLLEPIPIEVSLHLSEADLNRSLTVDLFAAALADLMKQGLMHRLQPLMEEATPSTLAAQAPASKDRLAVAPSTLHIVAMTLRSDALVMTVRHYPSQLLQPHDSGDRSCEYHVQTRLVLDQGHRLRFDQPQLLKHPQAQQGRSLPQLQDFTLNLGETVDLKELTLSPGQLTCRGKIWVQP